MSWIHVMHFTCPGGQAVMIICSIMYLFTEPYKWILWGRQKSNTWFELTSLCGLYTNNYAQVFFSICDKGIANNNWKTQHKKPHFWHFWNKVADVICKSFQDHGWWVYCWKTGRNGFFKNVSPSSWQNPKKKKKTEMHICQLFAVLCAFSHSLSPSLPRILSTAAVLHCRSNLLLQVIVNSLFRPLKGHISLLLCVCETEIFTDVVPDKPVKCMISSNKHILHRARSCQPVSPYCHASKIK